MARDRQANQRAKNVEAIGGRVEQLPQTRHLVEPAREVSIQEIGQAGGGKDDQRGALLLIEQQPQENGNREQSQSAQNVGNGEQLLPKAAFFTHNRPRFELSRLGDLCRASGI